MVPAPIPPASRDPDFGSSPLTAQQIADTVIDPGAYLRVLANPFLGLMGFVIWLMIGGWLLEAFLRNRELTAPLIPLVTVVYGASLVLVPRLFHYHCLDCGGTGRLKEWRRHVCPTSAARRLLGESRRFRGPPPGAQVILWLWWLMAAGILAHAFRIPLPR